MFLFPGQGSQCPGMGHDFYQQSDAARTVFDTAAGIMGSSFLDTLFQGTAEAVTDTRIAQTGLLTVGAAITRHLATLGVEPSATAGHSLGEFTALVAAGALAFEDALPLVRERSRLMAEEAPPGTMAAVLGLDASVLDRHLPPGVDVANYNGPDQTIISGTVEGIAAAEVALKSAGAKRVLRLNVSGAFHSRLMDEASARFRETLAFVPLQPPKVRFISSVSGNEESDPELIRDLLARQMAAPVQWTRVMEAIGAKDALEVGPGRVLQGLAKRMPGGPRIELAGTLEGAAQVGANT